MQERKVLNSPSFLLKQHAITLIDMSLVTQVAFSFMNSIVTRNICRSDVKHKNDYITAVLFLDNDEVQFLNMMEYCFIM